MNNELIPHPSMNLNVNNQNEPAQIVKPEEITNLVKVVMSDIDVEGEQIQEKIINFADMILNSGDSTSASKEAMVNLLKLKSDLIDKKTKMLEMLVKLHNREGIGPKTVIAQQSNEFNLDKRSLFKDLDGKK